MSTRCCFLISILKISCLQFPAKTPQPPKSAKPNWGTILNPCEWSWDHRYALLSGVRRPKPHRKGRRGDSWGGCFGELGIRKSMSKNFQYKSFHWITIFESQSFDNFVRFMASQQVAHFRILTKQQITHCSCYVFTLGYARSQTSNGVNSCWSTRIRIYVPNSPWITQINKTVNFRCRPFWKKMRWIAPCLRI